VQLLVVYVLQFSAQHAMVCHRIIKYMFADTNMVVCLIAPNQIAAGAI
jgi:hypothetical protein